MHFISYLKKMYEVKFSFILLDEIKLFDDEYGKTSAVQRTKRNWRLEIDTWVCG